VGRPSSPLPTSALDGKLRVGVEPYDSEPARWVLARAEAELADRYGMLAEQEQTLTASQFAPPEGAFWVATRPDPIGGVGLRSLSPGVGEVKRLWVDPEARGQGVARALMAELERSAPELGCTTLRLNTGTRQPGAVTLYTRLGWTRRVEDWDGAALAKGWVLFSKDLAP
jgi:GNAT superfamily N-acetyltransferase